MHANTERPKPGFKLVTFLLLRQHHSLLLIQHRATPPIKMFLKWVEHYNQLEHDHLAKMNSFRHNDNDAQRSK